MRGIIRTGFRPAALAGVILLVAAPATPQLNRTFHSDGWILAAAHTPGLQSSIWRTDLWIHTGNAGASNYIDFTFCRASTNNAAATPIRFNLVQGQYNYYFEDVVEEFLHVGDGAWQGAIHYVANTQLQVWARVYSISADGSKTYGQLVEGIPSSNRSPDTVTSVDPDMQQWIYAAMHTADGRFRANLGIVNPTGVEARYYAAIYDATGNFTNGVNTGREVTIPPYSMVQLNDPFAAVNGGEWRDYRITANCQTEGGGTFAYVSVVDNATNDAYFVRGVKGLPPGTSGELNRTQHTDGWILAAAHSPGLKGSIWRTDLWVRTEAATGHTVNLTFCRSGNDNSAAVPIALQTPDGAQIFYVEDVVEHFLHVGDTPWVGAIHYTADTDVQVWARVYSVSSDGTKSYGQLVEGIPTVDMSPDDDPWYASEHQWIYATKHTADGRYRVNIGIVNPTAVASAFSVQVYDATGNGLPDSADYVQVEVPPFSMVQLTDPFATVNGGEWNNFAVRVDCDTDGGGTFAYASVVDNATNDAFFVRGVKRQAPK